MERSFARAKRYGFDRARWRGLWRVRIQEYLVAAIQNIQILVRYGTNPRKAVSVARVREKIYEGIASFYVGWKLLLVSTFKLKVNVEHS